MHGRHEELKVEHEDLITYSAKKRLAGLLMKVLWGAFIGATSLLGFLALAGSSQLLLLGALLIGGSVFAIKATQDIYRRNKEEKKLSDDLNAHLLESMDALQNIKPLEIDKLVDSLQTNPELHMVEKLYAHICELEMLIKDLMPFMLAKKNKDPKLKQSLDLESLLKECDFTKKFADWKTLINDKREPQLRGKEPDSRYFLCPQPPAPPAKPRKSFLKTLKGYAEKVFNRLLSFAGGASAAVSVGVGITTILGLSISLAHPFGWAVLAIIAGAVAAGLIGVYIDYRVTMGQENKIAALTLVQAMVEHAIQGVDRVNIAVHEMENVVQERTQLKDSTSMNNTFADLLQDMNNRLEEAIGARQVAEERAKTLEEEKTQQAAQLAELAAQLKQAQLQILKQQEEMQTSIAKNNPQKTQAATVATVGMFAVPKAPMPRTPLHSPQPASPK